MVSPVFAQTVYVSLFALATVVCFASLTRLKRIEDTDTRRGLGALLALSGLWAVTQIVHILVPIPSVVAANYTVGLVIGLATVGAWLYFCSAYAGRSYHRKPVYRRAALGVYIPIVLFKLTNPWHGLYFDMTSVSTPFQYVTIQEKPMFWVIAGFAYVSSSVGFYMLVDVFEKTRLQSRAAKAVVALAALPVLFDVIGYLSPPPILELNYESIGVGLFAIGALYVVREPFFAVSRYGRTQLIDTIDDAVLILDADDRVQDFNAAAHELLPALADHVSPSMEDVSDEIAMRIPSDGETVELNRDGESRYFIIRTVPIEVGATEIGRGVVCTDVSEIERQRRELQRKDSQLEGFATALTHELRNSVGIVSGQAELLSRMAMESDDSVLQSRAATIVEEASDMEEIVEQLRILARYSQTISQRESVDIGDVTRTAERRSNLDAADVDVENPVAVKADAERLRELLIQAFEFGVANGASEIEVTGHRTGFSIEYDGRFLDEFDEQAIFAYGNAVPNPDSALMPPNIQMLATTHGWTVEITDEDGSGTSIVIKNAQTNGSEDGL